MAQEKRDGSIDQEPSTLSEAKIILAFLNHRLDQLEVQLITSRKEIKDALNARQTLSDTLAFYLKDQGAATERYRQEITIMRMKLDNREAELRTLQIQHNTLVERVLRDRDEQFTQTLQDHQEKLRHQHVQQGLAETRRALDQAQSPGNPSEEPDFGCYLIDLHSTYDADLPPTLVPEDWVAGSPPLGNLMEFEVEELRQGSSSKPSGTKNAFGQSGTNVVDFPPSLVVPDREINWEEYIGLGSTRNQTFEYDNNSDATTEPFTPSETGQIYHRHFPHLLTENVENAVGEAQDNGAGQTPSEEQQVTAEDASGENGKGKEAHRGESSGNDSGRGSSDVDGKGKSVDCCTPTTGAAAGDASTSGNRSAIAHPMPTVLRTGLHLPSLPEDVGAGYTTQEVGSLPTRTYDHFARHERIPSFFEFGIQFDPPVGSRHHFRRTVHIGNLPACITLHSLMLSVRGGVILRVSIIDTVPITGTPSALVTFVEPQDAANYVAFASIHPIRFFGSVATVTLIATPNFPMPLYLHRATKNCNQTRVLRLDGFQISRLAEHTLLNNLDLEWAVRLQLIESIHYPNGFTVDFTFSSVEVALHAFFAFQTNEIFSRLEARASFQADPCAEPLETLLRQQAEMYGGLQDTSEECLYDPDAPADAYDDAEMSDYEPNDGFGDIFRLPTPESTEEPMDIRDDDLDNEETMVRDEYNDNNGGGGPSADMLCIPPAAEMQYYALNVQHGRLPCPAIASHAAQTHPTPGNRHANTEQDGEDTQAGEHKTALAAWGGPQTVNSGELADTNFVASDINSVE